MIRARVKGRIDWGMSRTDEGHREYTIKWLVVARQDYYGPSIIQNAYGLAQIGAFWNYGGQPDAWAYCTPYLSVIPLVGDPEKAAEWVVEQKFSTLPRVRCQDNSIEDPLSEPPKLSGSFVKYTEEATEDRNGKPIRNSAFQVVRGPLVERDRNRFSIVWTLNQATLPLDNMAGLIDVVNADTMYGLSKRKIKLSNIRFERQLYGTCGFYYPTTFDLDVNFKTFDRKRLDEGTMVLAPNGDKDNPKHFEAAKDKKGENIRVFLNGEGSPIGKDEEPFVFTDELYEEGNLLLTGIPATLT